MQTQGSQTVTPLVYGALLQENSTLKAEVADLRSKLAWFERQIFGQKSERFVASDSDVQQLVLQFEAEAVAVAVEQQKQIVAAHERARQPSPSQHQGRMPIPEHLPRVEEVIEPEEDTTDMVRIGEDVTEVVEVDPGRIWVRRTVRPRYARSKEQQAAADMADVPQSAIVQAPAPDVAFPRLKAGVSMLVHILVSKYVDHLPLYRIIGQLARQGLKVPDSTMGEWVKAACKPLLPLYQVYEKHLLLTRYLQIDETILKVLEDGKGKCHLGYLWAVFDPVRKLPFFFYQQGRDQSGPKKLLERFAGVLQCDGYSVYEALQKQRPAAIRLLHCLAHIRREFFEAQVNDQQRAAEALNIIGLWYTVERQARHQQLDPEARLALRQQQARPVFDLFKRWLEENYPKVLPASTIGKAIAYALRRWGTLEACLADGALEVDNNLVENIIRPIAIGRKNYLFAGSHEAAKRTAMLYTFFSACKQRDIDPQVWLRDVLGRICNHPVNRLEELLPHNWTPPKQ